MPIKLSLCFFVDQTIDFFVMDVAVNAAAGALKAFFADLPDPLIPYSLHPELVEAASKNGRKHMMVYLSTVGNSYLTN